MGAGVLTEVGGLRSSFPLLLRLFPSSSEAAAVHAPFFSRMDSVTAAFRLVLFPVFPFLGIFLLFAVGLWKLSMLITS